MLSFKTLRQKITESGREIIAAAAGLAVGLVVKAGLVEFIKAPRFTYSFECYGPDGKLKWADGFSNLVTTGGKNDLLTQYFKGSSYTAAWYLGLVDNSGFSAFNAADTMSSHAGWTESTAYSNANRVTLAFGTASAGSLATSAAASFNINATATINGAFSTTVNTKGGTTGILYSEGSFAAARSVSNGDTLNVSLQVSA